MLKQRPFFKTDVYLFKVHFGGSSFPTMGNFCHIVGQKIKELNGIQGSMIR